MCELNILTSMQYMSQKKVCLCQGEGKTESYTESNQKTNNFEYVDPLLLNILHSIHYAYAILYVRFPFLSI